MATPLPPQSLRYPNTIVDKSTDYLLIGIYTYSRVNKPSDPNTEVKATVGATGNQKGTLTTISQFISTQGGIQDYLGQIILPIPSNIQDGNSVGYGDDSLDTLTGLIAGGSLNMMQASGNNINDIFKNFTDRAEGVAQQLLGSGGQIQEIAIKSLAASAASVFGGNISLNQILARESGKILNPNTELLFNGVNLRSFKFSFKMVPRDEDEMVQVKSIIRLLKKNMAPKAESFFLNAPNVFQLAYKKGSGNHPFLHKFKPCALTDMAVNYTGENVYATYYDGTPVSMIMDLTFKELVPIYDSDYSDTDTTVGY